MFRKISVALLTALFALGAWAHDHEGLEEGTVVEVDTEERLLTIRYEDGTTYTYVIEEDAEIITFDGIREREHDIEELRPGLMVELELEQVGDEMNVRSVSGRSTSHD